MVLTVQRATDWLLQNLGVTALVKATPEEVINDTLAWLENANDWNCLQHGQAQLPLVKDRPFVPLPLDVKQVTGYSATRALVNTFSFTTLHEIIRLRAQRTVTSQLHFWGALEYVPAAGSNLLLRTEGFGNALWTAIPASAATVTANTELSPISSETTADEINTPAGVLDTVAQDVPYRDLTSGDYTFSVYLKEDESTPVSSNASRIILSTVGGTTKTTVEVDWSASPPTISFPVGEQVGTNAGEADRSHIEVLSNGWVRVGATVTYDKTEGGGDLRCEILPGEVAATTGSVDAFGAQLERTLKSTFGDFAAVNSTVPTEYQPERVSKRRTGVPRRFAFALWPTPTSDSANNGDISITYERQFTRVGDDCDFVDVPDYLEHLFKEALLRMGRGWEEYDSGSPAERLQGFRNSELFVEAEYRDTLQVPSLGPMVNCHMNSRAGYINWDTGNTSALP